jgi:hypothetical protein
MLLFYFVFLIFEHVVVSSPATDSPLRHEREVFGAWWESLVDDDGQVASLTIVNLTNSNDFRGFERKKPFQVHAFGADRNG